VQVVNAHTGREVWIARQYIAGVSETDTSLLTVGLTKELDYRSGTVAPRVKRVIEMPSCSGSDCDSTRHLKIGSRAATPVVTIRLETDQESQGSKALLAICICAVVLALMSVFIFAADRIIQ
jgi:hypothetical protein